MVRTRFFDGTGEYRYAKRTYRALSLATNKQNANRAGTNPSPKPSKFRAAEKAVTHAKTGRVSGAGMVEKTLILDAVTFLGTVFPPSQGMVGNNDWYKTQ